MIKLVVSDLDGTLLRSDKQSLEPETLELIHRLQERGILFVAASGRQYPNMYQLFETVGKNMHFICENGSLVIHKGKVYQKKIIDNRLGMELIRDILATNKAEVLISGERTSYILPKEKSYENLLVLQVKNDMTVLKTLDDLQEEFIKISLYFEGYQRVPEAIENKFRTKYGGKLQIVVSGNEWLDFIPLESGKGNALKELMLNLGITKEETMVFGDNENDISMLSLTPNSYAMSHATDTIKKYASSQCRYVDDILMQLLNESLPV
jgi:Cof subfamily protein (haloacid dehalogenase superfamily)